MSAEEYAAILYYLAGARGRIAGMKCASSLLAEYGHDANHEYLVAIQAQCDNTDATLAEVMRLIDGIYKGDK